MVPCTKDRFINGQVSAGAEKVAEHRIRFRLSCGSATPDWNDAELLRSSGRSRVRAASQRAWNDGVRFRLTRAVW